MTGRSIGKYFKKYTMNPVGFWQRVAAWFQLDPNRSTGVPLNSYYRNPMPGGNDPQEYHDPTTVPAADLADNPYWKRDVRRSYPRRSVVTQGDVVGLLTLGSKAFPKDDVLQIGEEGTKQLAKVKDEGDKVGLPAYFAKDQKNMDGVLAPNGMPPLPTNLGANMKGKEFEIVKDQAYGSQYPCRTFG